MKLQFPHFHAWNSDGSLWTSDLAKAQKFVSEENGQMETFANREELDVRGAEFKEAWLADEISPDFDTREFFIDHGYVERPQGIVSEDE